MRTFNHNVVRVAVPNGILIRSFNNKNVTGWSSFCLIREWNHRHNRCFRKIYQYYCATTTNVTYLVTFNMFTCLQAIPKVFFCTFYHQCLIEIFETNKPCTSISIRPDYSIHLFMSIESRIRYKSVLNEITTTVIIIYIGWKKIPQEWKREMFRNDSVQVQNPCEKHMFVILQPVKLKKRGILFWF